MTGLTCLVNPVDLHFDTEFGDLRHKSLSMSLILGLKSGKRPCVTKKKKNRDNLRHRRGKKETRPALITH